MSTEFKTIPKTGKTADRLLSLQSFCGPNNKPMLQLTQGFANYTTGDLNEPGFVQLSLTDAYSLAIGLCEWIQATTKERAIELESKIASNEALRKTIIKDAVDCGKFIENLKMIEIPIRLLS